MLPALPTDPAGSKGGESNVRSTAGLGERAPQPSCRFPCIAREHHICPQLGGPLGCRLALPRTYLGVPSAYLKAAAAQDHPVQHRDVVAHHRGLADNDACGMIQQQPVAQLRRGVDVHCSRVPRADAGYGTVAACFVMSALCGYGKCRPEQCA
jgi:hypothetical protein